MTVKMVSPGSGGVSVAVSTPESVTATLTGIYGGWKDAVIALDEMLSAEVDLGASFHQMQIRIPTIDAADVGVEVAEESGGTFYTLGDGTAVIKCGTGSMMTAVCLGGFRYVKISTSGPQTAARTFRVRGSNV